MVRDIARQLDKQVELTLLGQTTDVDRDILEKLEAPINHIVRNALDHGLETPAERNAAGKCATGKLTVEARHRAGTLSIEISDDGRGMDKTRVTRGLGLLGASERAAAIGGELRVESAPGGGVRLSLRVPLPATAAAGAESVRAA